MQGDLGRDGFQVVRVVPGSAVAKLWKELTADPAFVPGATPTVVPIIVAAVFARSHPSPLWGPQVYPATPWTCSAPVVRQLRCHVRSVAPFGAYKGLFCEMLPGYLSCAYRIDPRRDIPTLTQETMVLGFTNCFEAEDEVVVYPGSHQSSDPKVADKYSVIVRIPPGGHLFYDSRLILGDNPGIKRRAGTAFRITDTGQALFSSKLAILKSGFAVPLASPGTTAGFTPTSAAVSVAACMLWHPHCADLDSGQVFSEPYRYILPYPSGQIVSYAIGKTAYGQNPSRAYYSLVSLYRPTIFGFEEWPEYPPPYSDFFFFPELFALVYESYVPPYTIEERKAHLPGPIS